MSEIPSAYLVDKAIKAKNQEALVAKDAILHNKHKIDSALAEGLSTVESLVEPLELPSIMEKVENESDITLTELEKTLSDRDRRFAWGLAKARLSGKTNLTQIALDAGFPESTAAKNGSKLAKNPVIAQVVLGRMPGEMKLKAVKERREDYVIEKMVMLIERSMQEVQVLDRNGDPTGYYTYEGALAKSALDSLANWMGMTKTKVEMGGNNGDPIKVETADVTIPVLSMADRIRGVKSAKAVAEAKTMQEVGKEELRKPDPVESVEYVRMPQPKADQPVYQGNTMDRTRQMISGPKDDS